MPERDGCGWLITTTQSTAVQCRNTANKKWFFNFLSFLNFDFSFSFSQNLLPFSFFFKKVTFLIFLTKNSLYFHIFTCFSVFPFFHSKRNVQFFMFSTSIFLHLKFSPFLLFHIFLNILSCGTFCYICYIFPHLFFISKICIFAFLHLHSFIFTFIFQNLSFLQVHCTTTLHFTAPHDTALPLPFVVSHSPLTILPFYHVPRTFTH